MIDKKLIDIIDTRKGEEDGFFRKLAARNQVERSDVAERVKEIIDNVRINGDTALFEYTRIFDGVELFSDKIKVSNREIDAAYDKVDRKLIDVILKAKRNIEAFHLKQNGNTWFTNEGDGIVLGQLYRPLDTVGVYVPGGTAVLTSTVLMNIIPAKVAGVRRIIMVTPPCKDGSVSPAALVAANEAGADEIYRIGGAQAIAALAFGTQSVPKADKIFGPGNIYVATAKKMVYGYCDIDMFAGPSEIAVVADESANPAFIAADLLSQAEHDILSSAVLVTTSEKLAGEVQLEIEKQYVQLTRKDILVKSISDYGAIIITESIDKAMDVINEIAPEHLELCVEKPFELLDSVKNAGAVFLGNYSSEPLGDYFAGPNHVLPTGGTARFFSPLCVGDFVKKSSIISYTRDALQAVKDDIVYFAESEGLTAHANAIRIRFGKV